VHLPFDGGQRLVDRIRRLATGGFACVLVLAAGCAGAPRSASLEAAAPGTDGAGAITETGYREAISTLASDEFEGRKPGQPGETKTLEWLEAEYRRIGLQPGNAGSFRQEVPLVEITASPSAVLEVQGRDGSARFAYGDDMVVWTKRVVPESRLEVSDLVFVGYGIVAPEVGWNDYAGLDMRGKTAVILVNDPDFEGGEPLFRGPAMTYYGRWTYKYEEAARQGAAGALLVHETLPAAYGWDTVRNSWTGPQLDAESADGNARRPAIEGWLTLDATRRLLALGGRDFDRLKAAARTRGFRPVPLEATATVGVRNAVRRARSANLVGVIPGSRHPDEYVIYMGHWDHLGRAMSFAGAGGDSIFNGAVDNATGIAGILEIAKAFQAAGRPPERTVAFLAVTAEESGLLGSLYYGRNPLFPLARTAAVINIDALPPYGRTHDIEVIGYGASELEDYLREFAAEQGRVLRPDQQPEKGFFYRSDHFELAKQGVPALYVKTGMDSRTLPPGALRTMNDDYIANRYHKPGDHYDPAWDVAGSIEDLQLLYRVGNRVANERRWPGWYPASEFRAIRERSRAAAR
jgi:Zn-dependent M28 family amino/carboxypeptidase